MSLFKRYQFKPSFEIKTKAKIIQLTEKYELICLKAINKEKLTSEENYLLMDAINDIKEYTTQGIFFKMTENYNSKLPIEKKAETLFNQLLNLYSYTGDPYSSVKIEIEELVLDTIYGALGYDKAIKPFIKQKENSYLIKYIQSLLFYKILNFLEEKTNSLKQAREDDVYKNETHSENDLFIALEESDLKESIPEDVYNELKEAILKESYPKHLIPYIQFLKA